MSKLRIFAVAAAFCLVAASTASATTLEPHALTPAHQHPDVSIPTDMMLLPPIGTGVETKPYGYWPPTETY